MGNSGIKLIGPWNFDSMLTSYLKRFTEEAMDLMASFGSG